VQASHLDAEFATKVMSCSTTMMVFSRLISFNSRRLMGFDVGHGRPPARQPASNFGSCASSMPISSHCFWPCDRLPAKRSRASDQANGFKHPLDTFGLARVSRQNNVPSPGGRH